MMRRFFTQSWGLLLIFAAWQLWVMSAHYNSIVAVSPVAVVRDIVLHPVLYLLPALWTIGFALSGLTAGLILGLLLAIAGWRSQILSATISPAALLFSSTPVVCLIPLLARIFGYQSRTEFVTVAIMTFFPGFVFASKGLRTLPPTYFVTLTIGKLSWTLPSLWSTLSERSQIVMIWTVRGL